MYVLRFRYFQNFHFHYIIYIETKILMPVPMYALALNLVKDREISKQLTF